MRHPYLVRPLLPSLAQKYFKEIKNSGGLVAHRVDVDPKIFGPFFKIFRNLQINVIIMRNQMLSFHSSNPPFLRGGKWKI